MGTVTVCGQLQLGQWTAQPGVQQVIYDLMGRFWDFFRSIFGGMGAGIAGPGRSARGTPSIQQPVTISLEEAIADLADPETGNRRVDKLPAGAWQGTNLGYRARVRPGTTGQDERAFTWSWMWPRIPPSNGTGMICIHRLRLTFSRPFWAAKWNKNPGAAKV